MTHDEATEFFDFTTGVWPEGSVFRYFARRPSDGTIYAETLADADALVRVTEWADRNDYNSYWMPNPTREKGRIRARSTDITHWQWLMVDIDPISPYYDADACAARIDTLLFDDPVIGPTMPTPLRVNSGRGQQALYPILPHPLDGDWVRPRTGDDTIPARTFAPQVAAFWLNTLRKQLGPTGSYAHCTIDTSCSDLPRLMRLPYTINAKTGRRGGIIHYPSESVWSASTLGKFVPKVRPDAVTPITAQRWTDFVPHMTVAGRRFLLEGQDEPGRHRQAAAAMLSMLDLGATKEQIMTALLYGAKRCTPQLDGKEVLDMVERRFR